jgi:hypothetical protein
MTVRTKARRSRSWSPHEAGPVRTAAPRDKIHINRANVLQDRVLRAVPGQQLIVDGLEKGEGIPAKCDGITKRKDGRYMARCTVHTPHEPKRKLIYAQRSKQVPIGRSVGCGDPRSNERSE